MASVPNNLVLMDSGAKSATEPASSRIATDAPLFRFRLRQLFAVVAAMCGLLTAMVLSSGMTSLVLLLAASVVVMHVFATALGTQLQARGEAERLRQKAAQLSRDDAIPSVFDNAAKLQAIRSVPRSPWHSRGCTYLPWLPRLVIGAMVLGGLSGAVLLSGTIGHRTSPGGIIVGAVSFAVLGGWVSFLVGNFYGVFRHGFREALAEQKKDHPPSLSKG